MMNQKREFWRLTIVMSVFVLLLSMWVGGCQNQTQEQKVEKLIKQLQDPDETVCDSVAGILGK